MRSTIAERVRRLALALAMLAVLVGAAGPAQAAETVYARPAAAIDTERLAPPPADCGDHFRITGITRSGDHRNIRIVGVDLRVFLGNGYGLVFVGWADSNGNHVESYNASGQSGANFVVTIDDNGVGDPGNLYLSLTDPDNVYTHCSKVLRVPGDR
jgi:hypothetical protein